MSTPDPDRDPSGAPPPEPELSADDERMNAWLDRQLGPGDAQRFEQELADDPARGKDARTLAQVLAQLRTLPTEQAPRDLLDDVQSDIRSRSRGRYFGYHWKYRFPYEALLTALFLIIAVVVYVVARPAQVLLIPIEAKTFLVSGSDLGVGARILSDYGSFVRDPEGPVGGPWVQLIGDVAGNRIEALRTELSLYPSMRLDSEEVVGAAVRVRVAIKR